MFGLFRKKSHTPTALLLKNLDSPTADQVISRPELEIRGWLAFDCEFDFNNIVLTLEAGKLSLPVAQENRPQIAEGLPNEFVYGFNTFFDIQEDLQAMDMQWAKSPYLKICWPDGEETLPVEIALDRKLNSSPSYFHCDDKTHSNEQINKTQLSSWDENGFLLLQQFYSESEVDEITALFESAWENRSQFSPQVSVDQYIGTGKEERVSLSEADPKIRSTPYKLNDLYLECDRLRDYIMGQRLRDSLVPLIGGSPMICNSLSFEYGSQQQDHFDTFFMPPLTRNRMLASWIALEDVHQDAGPLRYYPGSHKIPPYRFKSGRYNLNLDEHADCYHYIDNQIASRNLEPVEFSAKKGDVFIWHAHLLHGGLPINNPKLTRRSIVTHYFCQEDWDKCYYKEYKPGYYYLKRP
jgi:phytanoyl-CoA hydroxylase